MFNKIFPKYCNSFFIFFNFIYYINTSRCGLATDINDFIGVAVIINGCISSPHYAFVNVWKELMLKFPLTGTILFSS